MGSRRSFLGALGFAPFAPVHPYVSFSNIQTHPALSQLRFVDLIDPKKYEAILSGSYSPTDPSFDLSDIFRQALAQVLARPNGGEIVLPPGVFNMSLDLRQVGASDFTRTIRISGAGRGITIVRPERSGGAMLDLSGRSRATIHGLTLRSGGHARAECGIYLARTLNSPNANGNKFVDVEVEGDFSGPAVVSCAAESSLWFNCRFSPTGEGAIGFWTGTDATIAGIVAHDPKGITGPNSDNRMIACEFYMPQPSSSCFVASRSGGWLLDCTSFVVGAVQRGNRMVVIKDFDKAVFNGPIHLRDCHFESFGTDTYGVYVEGAGLRYLYDLSITGGAAVVDESFRMIDYSGRQANPASKGLYLLGGTFKAPAAASGSGTPLPLSLHTWAMERAHVHWRPRGDGGLVSIPGFAKNSFLDASKLDLGQNVSCFLLGEETRSALG